MPNAGPFKIDVWRGGYPVWCELYFGDNFCAKFTHRELADLRHVVDRAMAEARANLPEGYRDEVGK